MATEPRAPLVGVLLLVAGTALAVVTSGGTTSPVRPPMAAAAWLASAGATDIAESLATASPFAQPSVLPAPSSDVPIRAIPDGYRIRIPRVGVDLFIREGDLTRDVEQARTPEGFAFHLPGTTLPGERGNTYLYAHARVGMFLSLWDVRSGDQVLIVAPDGRVLVYVVREVLPRVAPDDVAVTRPTPDERLTLQTSTGPRPSDPRFVVLAYPRGG